MGDRPLGGDSGRFRQEIGKCLERAGAVSWGMCRCGKVSEDALGRLRDWLGEGCHAGMGFMERNLDLRENPEGLLEGCDTIVTVAFSYANGGKSRETNQESRENGLGIAEYAYVGDYHVWVRRRLLESGLAELLGEEYRDWKLCVDSAPLMERYWGVMCGVGEIGRNGALIVPGVGCKTVLGIILLKDKEPRDKSRETREISVWDFGICGNCRRCVDACPTGALRGEGTIDCNRCLSYLTIEHRGEWRDRKHKEAMSTPAGRHTLFGCDRCMSVCPHNNDRACPEPVMQNVVSLDGDIIREMAVRNDGSALRGSCLRRAGVSGLNRNLDNTVS